MITEGEFQKQYARLIETYGKDAFGTERAKVLWEELKRLSAQSVEKIISHLIVTYRQVPLLPEFREAIAIERERLWNIEKEKNRNDAKEFFEGSKFSDQEVSSIFQTIIKRLKGEVSEKDFEGMVSVLSSAVNRGE